jgi:hypothetical protein
MLMATHPASAASDAPYYGPQKGFWQNGVGYKDKVEKDGARRVDATARGDHALDIAMYRAAEIARDEGFAYVEFLGGSGRSMYGNYSATLYFNPVHSPAPPKGCRSNRRGTCYTAVAGEVLRILGGRDGTQPGVPVVDHLDEHGRQVSISGFGIAAASAARLATTTPAARSAPRIAPQPSPFASSAPPSARPLPVAVTDSHVHHEQLLKAEQGVRGRDPNGRWSISD